ncbi:MAG TPA: GPW/gp25 family protein, partial [Chthoniobacterales bacterium]|nr:GPW/gp25 family protein [Chthoniobacterales bacterium]
WANQGPHMADTKRHSRLNPSLMYMFRAAHKAKDAMKRPKWQEKVENGLPGTYSRAAQRVAITEATLRHEVTRDLEALMNCVSIDSTIDLSEFPMVKKSVVNYGFPDIAIRTIDELEVAGLEHDIEKVLCTHEPRLAATSLRIARDRRIDPVELKVRYVVHADLLCEPLNVPVEFIADVEVTTGKIHIFPL